MDTKQIETYLREMYSSLVEDLVQQSLGYYKLLYEKLEGIPDNEKEEVVKAAISNIGMQMKANANAIKPEDVVKEIEKMSRGGV